ncbi:hypothetical protein BC628DRAFT_1419151 [Trametes gibbosa]|nr:hypothetical protein BC628DRAFT_1419151 [Trametes gibbosa]
MATVHFPDQTLGAMMIGGIVGASLYGLTCSQGYMYYGRSQGDSLLMRLHVLAIWVLDSACLAFVGHILYYQFITRYGDPTVFETPVWSFVVLIVLTALVSFMVRGMYIKGVWHLSHENPLLTGGLALLSVFDFACGIILTAKAANVNAGNLDSLMVPLYLNFASSVVADACVAITLLYFLKGTRTGNARRDSSMGRVMLFAVNTGMLTAADAAVALATYAAMPHKYVFIMPFMVLSHFYTNALFASLNARTLGKHGDHVVSLDLGGMSAVSPPRFPTTSGSGGTHGTPQVSLAIPIQTVVETKTDSVSDNENEDHKPYSIAKAL